MSEINVNADKYYYYMTGFFSFDKATSLGKLNSNQVYSASKLTLCIILPMMEGFDKYILHWSPVLVKSC